MSRDPSHQTSVQVKMGAHKKSAFCDFEQRKMGRIEEDGFGMGCISRLLLHGVLSARTSDADFYLRQRPFALINSKDQSFYFHRLDLRSTRIHNCPKGSLQLGLCETETFWPFFFVVVFFFWIYSLLEGLRCWYKLVFFWVLIWGKTKMFESNLQLMEVVWILL